MTRHEHNRAKTRHVTIMFTDIKGFTARVSDGSRDDLAKLRSAHDRLLVPVFKHFNGTIVKTIGDAFLVRFDSPTDAVLCGVTIQEVLRQHNAFAKDETDRFDVRVAINAGDVDVSENDVMGEPVNIAARVEAIAEPGEVFFTEAVFLAMNRTEAPSAEVGEHSFKGIPYSVRVYKVATSPDSDLTRRVSDGVRLTDDGPVIRGLSPVIPKSNRRTALIATALIVIAFFVTAYVLLTPNSAERAQANAAAAMTRGDNATALAILEPELAIQPNHEQLKPLAIDAARVHAYHLRDAVGYTKALGWLRDQLRDKPYLDVLRKDEAILEAQRLAATFIDSNKDAWLPLKELANQNPEDWDVPLAGARVLAGNVFPSAPLNLYALALDRGYKDEHNVIFNYCLRVFSGHVPSAGGRNAHRILKKHYPEKAVVWARKAYVETSSGVVLENARKVLEDTSDPLLEDPWLSSVHSMLYGYKSEAIADEALANYKSLKDQTERERFVALLRWLLNPPKGVGWRYRYKNLLQRNLEALETEWDMKPPAGNSGS